MVTSGATGDVNVRITLDEGSAPDLGGRPPGPPTAGGMPPQIMSMFAKDDARQKGAEPLTQGQREQMAILKESLAIQKQAAEYAKTFNEKGEERKSIFQKISDGIKNQGMYSRVMSTAAGQGMSKMIGGLGKLAGPIGMIAGATGGMLLNTKVMQAGIGGLMSIIQAIFDIFMMPLAPIIAKGLQALAKVVTWLQGFMADPMGYIRNMIDKIGEWFGGIIDSIKEWWDNLIQGLKDALGPFAGIVDGILGYFSGIKDAFLGLFTGVLTGWIGLFTGVMEGFLAYFSGIKDAFISLWDGIKALFMGQWDQALEGFLGFFTGIFDAWIGLFSGIFDGFLALFSGIKDGWLAFFSGIFSAWIALFSGIFSSFLALFHGIGGDVVDFFKDAPGDIVDFFKELPGKIADFFKDIPGAITGMFKAVVQGYIGFFKTVWDLIKAVWNNVYNVAKTIFEWIMYYFKKAIDSLPFIEVDGGNVQKPEQGIVAAMVQGINEINRTGRESFQENVVEVVINNEFFKERWDVDTRNEAGRNSISVTRNGVVRDG